LNMIEKVSPRDCRHAEAQVRSPISPVIDVHPDLSLRVKTFLVLSSIRLLPEANPRVLEDWIFLRKDAHGVDSPVWSGSTQQDFTNIQPDRVHAHSRTRNKKESRQT